VVHINYEDELNNVIDKSKWIKEYDFHTLTGEKFDEALPDIIYYEPINKEWVNTIEVNGVSVQVYDFENIIFKTTQGESGTRFTVLYSYSDEWGNTRYTLNSNYTPHKKAGAEIH
jgi:hypothetical protein